MPFSTISITFWYILPYLDSIMTLVRSFLLRPKLNERPNDDDDDDQLLLKTDCLSGHTFVKGLAR